MYKIGENEVVSCPYDKSHIVSKLRIQKHIIKCKSRYPEVKLITCFYNYTHKLKPEDVLKHYEVCSQKIRMEEARYCESNPNISCNWSEVNGEYNSNSESNDKASFVIHKTDSVKSDDAQSLKCKIPVPQNEAPNGSNKDDGDDLTPLNLPKTVSKAFSSVKQEIEKSSELVPALPQIRKFGRGTKFFMNPTRPPRTNDHLLPDVSDVGSRLLHKPKSKRRFFLNNNSDIGNSCSASIISSFFDDGTTLKSDDITFDDDDYDDVGDDNDGFIFKNFDKYVKI